MTQTAAEWFLRAQDAAPMPMAVIPERIAVDPFLGPLPSSVPILRISENERIQRTRVELPRAIASFLKTVTCGSDLSSSAEWRFAAMRMAVPAVMLGMPEVVALIDRFPSTLHTPVDRDLLGSFLSADDPTLSLYGLAFRCSLPSVLDDLACLVCKHADKPGVDLTMGWAHVQEKPFGRSFDIMQFSSQMGPLLLPSVLVRAVTHHRATAAHQAAQEGALAAIAQGALERGNASPWQAFLPAFLSLGLYQHDVARSFQMACMHGQADVLRSLKGNVPWDRTGVGSNDANVSPILGALACAQQPPLGVPSSAYEEGLLEAARQAVAAGQQDLFFRKLPLQTPEGLEVEPLKSILALKFHRLLPRFLDQGWDPAVPLLPGARTLIEMAGDSRNSEAISIMKSHGARRKLTSLLDEMGSDGVSGFFIRLNPRESP